MNRTVYWLLDSRFDFLLDSFMYEFEVDCEKLVLVNSYHNRGREKWNKVYIPYRKKGSVILMEPEDINRIFAESFSLNMLDFVVSFSGAGLPQSDNLTSLTATGMVAEKCNDKWWQFCCFVDNQIPTPCTYQCDGLEELQESLDSLLDKYGKVVVKRPCLSGGYQMAVLRSAKDLEKYKIGLLSGSFDRRFLVSEYIPHQQSFAGMGMVRKDGEVLLINAVTEQVLYREVAYEGLIFPAFLSDDYKAVILRITEKVGKILCENGYFGFYNVDFVLGEDHRIYAVEINARMGFGTILAACLYGESFWKMLQGNYMEGVINPGKRLVLGKIKAMEGKSYSGLNSYSNIRDWYQGQKGFFKALFCGTGEPETFEYGSYLGMFGEFFGEEVSREKVLDVFWKRCLEYYFKKEMIEVEK